MLAQYNFVSKLCYVHTYWQGWLAGNHPPQFWKLCVGSLELFRIVYQVNPKEITFSNYLIRQSFLSLLFHLYPISTTILAVISFVTITQEAYMRRRSLAKFPTAYTQMTDLKHITKFLHSCIPKTAQNTQPYYVKSTLCYEDGKAIQLTRIVEQIVWKFYTHMLIHSLCLGRDAPCSITDYRII